MSKTGVYCFGKDKEKNKMCDDCIAHTTHINRSNLKCKMSCKICLISSFSNFIYALVKKKEWEKSANNVTISCAS